MKGIAAFAVVISVLLAGDLCLSEEAVVEAGPGVEVATWEQVPELPFKFKVQYWRSDGEAMFRNVGYDPEVGPWESEVEFPMDGNFVIFGAEYSFLARRSRFGIDLNYGFSQDIDGATKDWDWASYDPDPLVYAESDTDAESDFLSANFYYRVWGRGPKNSVDVFVGYHHQETSFTNRNVRVLIPDYFTVGGNVAQYDMEFNGVRAGIRTELALWPRLSVTGNLAFIPYADVDADGKWLLRDISFSQSADGYGVDFDVYLDFEITRNVSLTGGLKYLFLRATDGEESGFAMGMPYGPVAVVDEIESNQFGGTAGVLVSF